MSAKYLLDISKESMWQITTPTAAIMRLPLYVNEWGWFHAGASYSATHENQRSFLMIYTQKGRGTLCFAGSEYSLVPGTVVIFRCTQPYRYATSGDFWEFKWIDFDGSAAPNFCELVNGGGIKIVFLNRDGQNQFDASFSRISAFMDKNDIYNAVEVSAALMRMLATLIQSGLASVEDGGASHHERVKNAIDYIETHYMQRLSLEELAQRAFLSKYHFLRVFKEQTRVTPMDYLNGVRVSHAKVLLRTTDMVLSEISEMTGFSDSKNLIRVFKDKTGTTPGYYRKHTR